uniref:uncharacterized protein n=1 Tax=Myxine glutinosa TaxID=7769 RepID=UPI00358EB4DF
MGPGMVPLPGMTSTHVTPILLLLLCSALTEALPEGCSYIDSDKKTLECKNQETFPDLSIIPKSTTKLHFVKNAFTSLPFGSLDNLENLEELKFQGVAIDCRKCSISYLHTWLFYLQTEKRFIEADQVKCIDYGTAKNEAVFYLGTEPEECVAPTKCGSVLWPDLGLHVLYAILIVPLAYSLHCMRNMTAGQGGDTLARQMSDTPYEHLLHNKIYEDLEEQAASPSAPHESPYEEINMKNRK